MINPNSSLRRDLARSRRMHCMIVARQISTELEGLAIGVLLRHSQLELAIEVLLVC